VTGDIAGFEKKGSYYEVHLSTVLYNGSSKIVTCISTKITKIISRSNDIPAFNDLWTEYINQRIRFLYSYRREKREGKICGFNVQKNPRAKMRSNNAYEVHVLVETDDGNFDWRAEFHLDRGADAMIPPSKILDEDNRLLHMLSMQPSAPPSNMQIPSAPPMPSSEHVELPKQNVDENDDEGSNSNCDDSMPNEYLCSITMVKMKDPVMCADGHTYERTAIEEWLKKHTTSPLTKLHLKHNNLIPNCALKALIQDWKPRAKPMVLEPAVMFLAAKNCGECGKKKAEIRCPTANCIGAEFCKDCVPPKCPGCKRKLKYPNEGCIVS
jgi:hypothetical protein